MTLLQYASGYLILPRYPLTVRDIKGTGIEELDFAINELDGSISWVLIGDLAKAMSYRDKVIEVIQKKQESNPTSDPKNIPRDSLVDVVKLSKDMAHYDSLWNEYRYRHDRIWSIMFRVILATVAVAILPYGKRQIISALDTVGFFLVLLIPVAILIFSAFILYREISILDPVKSAYRSLQKAYFNIGPKPAMANFKKRVSLLLGAMVVLALLNGIVAYINQPAGWNEIKASIDKYKCRIEDEVSCLEAKAALKLDTKKPYIWKEIVSIIETYDCRSDDDELCRRVKKMVPPALTEKKAPIEK